jgi:hypothetical protein
MFNAIITTLQLRRSTAFLLSRADDRLLDDIGLTRADLDTLRQGEFEVIAGGKSIAQDVIGAITFPSGKALPVAA